MLPPPRHRWRKTPWLVHVVLIQSVHASVASSVAIGLVCNVCRLSSFHAPLRLTLPAICAWQGRELHQPGQAAKDGALLAVVATTFLGLLNNLPLFLLFYSCFVSTFNDWSRSWSIMFYQAWLHTLGLCYGKKKCKSTTCSEDLLWDQLTRCEWWVTHLYLCSEVCICWEFALARAINFVIFEQLRKITTANRNDEYCLCIT